MAGIGWKEVYGFYVNLLDAFIKPLKDSWLWFTLGQNHIYIIKQVYDYIYNSYTKSAEEWEEKDPEIAYWLRWDRDNMVLEGDENAYVVKPIVVYHQRMQYKYDYKDERVSWDRRVVTVTVEGILTVLETGEPLANRPVYLVLPTNDVISTNTDSNGMFKFTWVEEYDCYEHVLEFKLYTETFEEEAEDKVKVYEGDEADFTIKLPMLKTRTFIEAWVDRFEMTKLGLPLSKYELTVGFRVLTEEGKVLTPDPKEVEIKAQDHTGTWDMELEVNEVCKATNDQLQYPTIRASNLKYKVTIEYEPKDPRLARSSETLVIELKENISDATLVVLLALLILLGMLTGV